VSDLAEHARRELERCGQTESDPAYAQSIICAIAALMTYGHSGGSMRCAIAQLNELLQFRPLSPLTNDPDEWIDHGEGLWQSRRDSAAFSRDNGATYYYVDERRKTGRHMSDDVLYEIDATQEPPHDECNDMSSPEPSDEPTDALKIVQAYYERKGEKSSPEPSDDDLPF
jgi:hypothetical protein